MVRKKSSKGLVTTFNRIIKSGHKAKWNERKGNWVKGVKKL